SNPQLTVNPDGTYSFTTDEPGIYTYDVPVNVPGHPGLTEKLVITVTDPSSDNNPPVLNNDNSTTPYETAVTHNVLVNDQPGNGGGILDPSSLVVVSGPSNGLVDVDPISGELTYTPDDEFVGIDEVVYEVCES